MSRPEKKRWRRVLLAIVGGGLGLTLAASVWVLFFPVPVGWAVRLGLQRLPADTGWTAQLRSATFYWQWGQPGLRVDFEKVGADARGVPLLRAETISVVVQKRALWEKRTP